MRLTARRPRKIDRSKVHFRDASLFVIATEGECTEPTYFSIFHCSRIQIEIIPSVQGRSSPSAVLDRIQGYKRKYELNAQDKLYIVIDYDRWPIKMLRTVAAQCKRDDVNLIVSRPCFETWIHFHFASLPATVKSCSEVCDSIKKLTGSYNKSNLDTSLFNKANMRQAIARARTGHKANERWPSSATSHAFKIVEQLVEDSDLPESV